MRISSSTSSSSSGGGREAMMRSPSPVPESPRVAWAEVRGDSAEPRSLSRGARSSASPVSLVSPSPSRGPRGHGSERLAEDGDSGRAGGAESRGAESRGAAMEEEEEAAAAALLLRGIFTIGGKSCDVELRGRALSWSPIVPEAMPGAASAAPAAAGAGEAPAEEWLDLKDVFAVKLKRRRSAGQTKGGTLLGITLFVCRRRQRGHSRLGAAGPAGHDEGKLKEQPLHLGNSSEDHCQTWFYRIRAVLSGFPERPRRLLVFVNPQSHRKEAPELFASRVEPLFKLADIGTHLIVTEREGHALAELQTCDLTGFDGVVCVGGDGTVAEVVNGLLLRAQRDVGTDPDGAFTPAPTHLPIGIIPAGSTDVVAYSMHGTSHAATASLHIILGHLLPVDVCSLAVRGRLLRFGFSAMLGFGGRSLAIAERHRWMPPNQRRDFAVLKALASLRPVDCEIGFLPASEGASGQTAEGARALKRWDLSAKIPGGAQVGATGEDAAGLLWLHTSGDFLNVTVAAVPCRCAVAPRGLAPDTLLDDGSMSLIAVRSTSRAHFVKYLKRFGSSKSQPNPPFVDSMAVQAVRVTPRGHLSGEDGSSRWGDGEGETAGATDGRCFWNVDGVLLEETGEVHIRVHTRLVTLYGCSLGHDDEDAAMKCNCL
uniref:Ceramide kinase-like protein isoform X1 n=1 Tax=Petromyzon marinus TaxID=7757 RepID=A0AAJ7X6U3_PETMA|nr:ceramide kinase-like protein isoform X1 [Petromyzon marinus]